MPRSGLSLLEVIIATGLFAGMVVLLMESLLNMRNLAAAVDDLDRLEEQADRARRAIARDFSNSGWYYCRPGASGRKFYPQIHLCAKQAWQPDPISPVPTVTVQDFDQVSRTMVTRTITASVSQNMASVLGDAVVFARLQPEGQPLTLGPAPLSASIVDFSVQRPVPLDQYAHARAVQSLVINHNAVTQEELTSVLWETTPAKGDSGLPGGGLTASDLYDDSNVRLYAYRVIPDPTTGRGRLVRLYSNPGSDRSLTASWVEDAVVAFDVVSLRVYSFEMSKWYDGTEEDRDFSVNPAAGLTNNQLRFVIQFARNLEQIDERTSIDVQDRDGTSVTADHTHASSVKTVQFTVALRSITNSLDQ